MNSNDKIKEILSNFSENKIREIKLISDETVSCEVTYLKACFETEVISILLDEEEKDDFIRKLSEHGWYILYKDAIVAGSTTRREKYFRIADIESIDLINSYTLKIKYKNEPKYITSIYFDDPTNDTQRVIDSLKEAGRYDLLLKLS